MKKTRVVFVGALALTWFACSSKDPLLSVPDGGTGGTSASGTGGSSASGTGGSSGQGGTAGTATGGTTTIGAGGTGTVATGGSGLAGSGGIGTGGRGGTAGGSGGTTGTGGATFKDGGAADVAKDAPALLDVSLDVSDGVVECAPGYPVGTSKPLGDGCNTCYCQASGSFLCTTKACPADAAADACPSGQRWCPGCTPGTGSCGAVCTGAPCPVSDAAAAEVAPADTATACTTLTTQADCQARSDCHAVFTDPGTCGCAGAGCCAHFSRCADGGKALCNPTTTVACDMATPFCESPYVISYTTICYEGCVLSSECAP